MRITYRLSVLYRTLLIKLGFGKFLLKNRYGERMIIFHGIDTVGETKYNSRFVSKAYFETFIQYITQHYNVISLADFYAKKFKPNTLNIAITFDDGYLNNYKYAVPILEKYNVPATFFITTIHDKAQFLWADFLDLVSYYSEKKEVRFKEYIFIKNKKKEFVNQGVSLKTLAKTLSYNEIEKLYVVLKVDWENLPLEKLEDYWKLMSTKQIRVLNNHPLFTIGAHGETHANLTTITIDDAKNDISNSKQWLESVCQSNITAFAFPFGYYNQETIDFCKTIGFEHILLLDYNKNDCIETSTKNRFVMNPYISLELQISYLLKGKYI